MHEIFLWIYIVEIKDKNFCKLKFLKKLANLHLEIVLLIFIVCTIRIGTIIEQEHNIMFFWGRLSC